MSKVHPTYDTIADDIPDATPPPPPLRASGVPLPSGLPPPCFEPPALYDDGKYYPGVPLPCFSTPALNDVPDLPTNGEEGRTSHCIPDLPYHGGSFDDGCSGCSNGILVSEPKLSQTSDLSTSLTKQQKSRLSKIMQEEVEPDSPNARPSQLMRLEESHGRTFVGSGMPHIVQQMRKHVLNLTGKNKVGLFTSSASIHVYLGTDHEEEHPCVLNPNGMFSKIWNICTAVVVVYIVGVVSFDLGFSSWWRISFGAYIFNILVDVYCWIDIGITFRTGFVHGGHLIMDSKKIALHYLEFWFWIDVLASIPWELLLSVSKSNRKAVKFVKWLKLPRLLRLGRLRKIMKSHARYLNLLVTLTCMSLCAHLGACLWVLIVDPCAPMVDIAPFDDWVYSSDVDDTLVMRHPQLGWECTQGNIWNIYMQALHTSVGMLLGVDGASFGGYVSGGGVASSLHDEITEYSKVLASSQDDISEEPAFASMRALKLLMLNRRYPLSLADSMVVDSALGSGSCSNPQMINAESDINTYGLQYSCWMNVFGTLILVLGCYFQGMLFANIAKIVIFRNAAESGFRQVHDEAKRELDLYGHLIPQQVITRISKHFEFRWINQAYGPLQLLNPELLSRSLRAEIALYLYKDSVAKVEFLKNAPVEVVQMVCLGLERQYFMERDAIYRRGEAPLGFFIVDMGHVWLSSMDTFEGASRNTVEILELFPGDSFGVGAVVAAVQSNGRSRVVNKKNAFAVTVCNTLHLPLDAFRHICSEHPWFFKDLQHLEHGEEHGDAEAPDCRPSAASSFAPTAFQSERKVTEISSPVSSPAHGSVVSRPMISGASKASQHSKLGIRPSVNGFHLPSSLNGFRQQDANLKEIDCKELEDRVSRLENHVKSNTEKVDAATDALKELLRIASASSLSEVSRRRAPEGGYRGPS